MNVSELVEACVLLELISKPYLDLLELVGTYLSSLNLSEIAITHWNLSELIESKDVSSFYQQVVHTGLYPLM